VNFAGGEVAEVLVEFAEPVRNGDGKTYTARACGSEMPDGMWQGWIEFLSADGDPVRSARETTQPNREDTIYWATGLTPIFLEGCLTRTLKQPFRRVVQPSPRPHFDGPAASVITEELPAVESVLDPFSVYRKGEALLRRQLSALAGWHLVNIIRRYGLSRETPAHLNAQEPSQLIEMIIEGVRPDQRPVGSRI
jgi:hypothetical protein